MPFSIECAGVNVEVRPTLRHKTSEARSMVCAWSFSRSAEPAVRHDQFDLLVLDRVTPHLAAIRVNAAVTVDTVERSGADAHHHQRLLARRLEPIKRAVRQ